MSCLSVQDALSYLRFKSKIVTEMFKNFLNRLILILKYLISILKNKLFIDMTSKADQIIATFL